MPTIAKCLWYIIRTNINFQYGPLGRCILSMLGSSALNWARARSSEFLWISLCIQPSTWPIFNARNAQIINTTNKLVYGILNDVRVCTFQGTFSYFELIKLDTRLNWNMIAGRDQACAQSSRLTQLWKLSKYRRLVWVTN